METKTKNQEPIHKGDLITPICIELKSKYYLTQSEPNAKGLMFIRAATKKGGIDKRHSNYAFSALASNFAVFKTSVELRRESGGTTTERFDDIAYDAKDGDFWTQICDGCNDQLQLGATDGGVLQGLICGARGCDREADFYLDLDIVACADCRKDFERVDLMPAAGESRFLCEQCRTGEQAF